MCGRYALYGPHSRLQQHFELDDSIEWRPRFNIAPSQSCPIVRADQDGTRHLEFAYWGLIPAWARPDSELVRPINAKAETAAIKPMFRHAFRSSRVLIPASGFYEWQQTAGTKQPWFIEPEEPGYFALGGLLEHWNGPEGEHASFAILTTNANQSMRPVHDRMPVIIARSDWHRWLDPRFQEVPRLNAIVGLTQGARLKMHRVGRAVGNPVNDSPLLIEPQDDAATGK